MACFQVTVGLGNPSAWHCSTTDFPSTTLSSAGSTNHRGGTAGNKKIVSFCSSARNRSRFLVPSYLQSDRSGLI
jgi:hypothetical protein